MSEEEKYRKVFMESLGLSDGQLDELTYQSVPEWDSVGHMNLIAAIEDAFDIIMDAEDILEFSSFEKGKEILSSSSYGVDF